MEQIFCTVSSPLDRFVHSLFNMGSRHPHCTGITSRLTKSSQHDHRRGGSGYASKVAVVGAAVLGHGDRHGARGLDFVLHLEARLLLDALLSRLCVGEATWLD